VVVFPNRGRLTLWRCAPQAYIAAERFLFPETDSLFFLVVMAGAAHIVLEAAVSSCSRPSLAIVTTLSPVTLTGRDTIKRSRSPFWSPAAAPHRAIPPTSGCRQSRQ
jgi:hypothetical protein